MKQVLSNMSSTYTTVHTVATNIFTAVNFSEFEVNTHSSPSQFAVWS